MINFKILIYQKFQALNISIKKNAVKNIKQ